MKKVFFLVLSAVILSISVSATELREEMLKSGMFVRQMGMGGAATAVCDDASAIYYNPAGLARDNITGLSFGNMDNNKELMDEDHYYAYGFGSWGYMGYRRTLPTDDKVNVDMLSFSRRSKMGLSYGLTYKNILFDSPAVSDRGYSVDVGMLLNITPQLSIGLLGQDAIAEKSLEVASSMRLGLAYSPFDSRLIFAADTEVGRMAAGDYSHYGIEWLMAEGIKLRCGLYKGDATYGASLDLPFMAVHYAGMHDKDTDLTIHMIGGEFSIDQKPERPISVIRPKEYALIEIGGNIVGGVGDFSIFGGGKLGADSILANIKEANKDPYIDGIILRIRGFDGGLGSFGIVQEIREELLKSKNKGKKVIAYLEEGTLGDEYYLASVADKVIAPPSGTVGGLGKSISIIRIKGFLEMIGLESQIISKGKYKTTFSQMSPELTPAQKEMLQGVVGDLYRQMVNDIAESRKATISIKDLKKIADGRVFSSSKAKSLGLIDEIGYFADAKKAGADLFSSKDDIRVVERKNLIKDLDEDFLFSFPNKIAVIDIDGDIVTGSSGSNMIFGGHATGSDTVTEQIKRATDDWQVKAIIVRVNSGGGSAVASGQIYSELKKSRDKGKIIVASMGDVAASGGYYVSAAANKIVADPGTITGSIGVIQGNMLIYSGLLKKLNIKAETIKEGKYSDMYSGLRKLSTEEITLLTSYMDETYQEFVGAVASGRGMTTTEVYALAEGRIYTGSQAFDKKLVDKKGNFTDAVDMAADLAKITGEPTLVYYRKQDLWFGFGEGAVKMLGLEKGIFNQNSGGLVEYRLSM